MYPIHLTKFRDRNLTKFTVRIHSFVTSGQTIIHTKQRCKGYECIGQTGKIYLDNPNLLFALSTATANEGNVRETFFANKLKVKHSVSSSKDTDFFIDRKYQFEIGGRSKSYEQIKDLDHSYVALDGVESGFGNKIPLWLFGFLY